MSHTNIHQRVTWLLLQVVEVQGLEHSELRNKVGSNIADGSIVYLTGIDMDTNPALRHAGLKPYHKG